jgi:hypothetical protein
MRLNHRLYPIPDRVEIATPGPALEHSVIDVMADSHRVEMSNSFLDS